jgi:hypothetical protein
MLELYHNDLPVSIQEVKNLNISFNYNILSFDTCVIKSNNLNTHYTVHSQCYPGL